MDASSLLKIFIENSEQLKKATHIEFILLAVDVKDEDYNDEIKIICSQAGERFMEMHNELIADFKNLCYSKANFGESKVCAENNIVDSKQQILCANTIDDVKNNNRTTKVAKRSKTRLNIKRNLKNRQPSRVKAVNHRKENSLLADVNSNNCIKCQIKFDSEQLFVRHLNEVHDATVIYKCTSCKKIFRTILRFKLHKHSIVKSKVKIKSHNDDDDGEDGLKKSLISFHNESHTSDFNLKPQKIIKSKDYKCDQCSKYFISSVDLKRHLHVHASSDDSAPRLKCKFCHLIFTNPVYLRNHTYTHSKIARFSCPECPKRFKRRCHLIEHSQTHKDIRPYSCEKCGKTFKLESCLRSHAAVHKTDVRYQCTECGKRFKRSSSLRQHSFTHGERVYECDRCDKKFSSPQNLRAHSLNVHSGNVDASAGVGVNQHTCENCGKSFKHKRNLMLHSRSHDPAAMLSCHLCSKKYTREADLKLHLAAHGDRRPFVCVKCRQCFKTPSNMRRHALMHCKYKDGSSCAEDDESSNQLFEKVDEHVERVRHHQQLRLSIPEQQQQQQIEHNPNFDSLQDSNDCTFAANESYLLTILTSSPSQQQQLLQQNENPNLTSHQNCQHNQTLQHNLEQHSQHRSTNWPTLQQIQHFIEPQQHQYFHHQHRHHQASFSHAQHNFLENDSISSHLELVHSFINQQN